MTWKKWAVFVLGLAAAFAAAWLMTGCALLGEPSREPAVGQSWDDVLDIEGVPTWVVDRKDGSRVAIWEWRGHEVARGTFRQETEDAGAITVEGKAVLKVQRSIWRLVEPVQRHYHGYGASAPRH